MDVREYVGIGVMSGTSQDGIDLCTAKFMRNQTQDAWIYQVLHFSTIPYSQKWNQKLSEAPKLSGENLAKLHVEYGHLQGRTVKEYIQANNLDLVVQFVASHGHTIFHQPELGFTYQLLCGETMVSYLNVPLVTNFRSKDVALGGQGAPLVPSAEPYLFPDYSILLNLGGIANVSVEGKGFDICPCNMLLNYIMQNHADTRNEEVNYDEDGKLASKGKRLRGVLERLERLEYYKQPPPKTLGREWFEENVTRLLRMKDHKAEDLLHTSVLHISQRIAEACKPNEKESQDTRKQRKPQVLVTGGGALNRFLISQLEKDMDDELEVMVPERETVEGKEALSFAFLGVRCLLGLTNIKSSTTGSDYDSVSGSIHMPARNRDYSAIF